MEKASSPLAAVLNFVDRVLYHIEEKVLAFSIIFMALILIGNVILRCFNSSIAPTEELCQFLIFFTTFLGTCFAARKGMHIRMSLLNDILKGKAKKALAITVAIVSAIVMFYVAYLSFRYVMKVSGLNRVTPILQLPVQYIWIVMPIGMFLTGVQYLLAFIRNLTTPGCWISYTVPMEDEPTALSDFNEQVNNDPESIAHGPGMKHLEDDSTKEAKS